MIKGQLKVLLVTLLVMIVLASGCSGGSSSSTSPSAPSGSVSININTTYQTLIGFGAACAWYGNWLTGNPNKSEIYDLLFKELGLDILRFRNTYGSRNGAAFCPYEAELLTQAKSRNSNIKTLICSWSPPADLKANSVLNGGTLAKINGSFNYSGFADYWYNSLVQYRNKGITPDYISIQNEPDYENTGWETCRFDPAEGTNASYGKALDGVYNKIQTLSNIPKIIGPETAGIGSNSVQNYMSRLNASQLYGVAHHLYNGGTSTSPDTFITNLQALSSAYGTMPLFQTEYDLGGGFNTALHILNSLVSENVSAYFYWDLIWSMDQIPLIHLENPSTTGSWTTSKGYSITDYYYVLKQFAKFTDPGFKRVAASSGNSNIKTAAFVSADQQQLTVILINTGSASDTVTLNFTGFTPSTSRVYRTVPGGSEKCSDAGALGTGNSVTMPAKSIVTVVLQK